MTLFGALIRVALQNAIGFCAGLDEMLIFLFIWLPAAVCGTLGGPAVCVMREIDMRQIRQKKPSCLGRTGVSR